MKRLTPFSGMQVTLFDATFWTSETADAIKQRINSDLYNKGAVNGLTVFGSGTSLGYAAVTPGVAYDSNGERIGVGRLQDLVSYSGSRLNDTSSYDIALRYAEGNDGTSGLDVDGLSSFRHAIDSFSVVVGKVGVDTLQSSDVTLARVFSATNGSTLIFNTQVRDVFSAKFAATGTNLQAAVVNVGGSLVVGGSITSLMGGSFASMFVGDGGMSVTGTACFFRATIGVSDIQTKGDFRATTAGKGIILISPDGTKTARLGLGNDGFLSQTPLNYTLS